MPANLAPVPLALDHEQARVKLLHALNLLDSDPEPVFDHITRLLSRLLDVPIALVSLVDSDRQWFKSVVGLPVRETPREYAFCAHAILGRGAFVVEDAQRDARFADNPLVTGTPNIRFYAGVPLRTSEGHALGTLCAIDSRPRHLSPEQEQILSDLAELVNREIGLREAALLSRKHLQRTDAQLELAEHKFKALFEHAGSGMALIAPGGSVLKANKALCGMLGYSVEELLSLSFQALTLDEDRAADSVQLQQLTTGQIDYYELEKRYIRKGGEPLWVHVNVTQYLDADGDLDYFLVVVNDIQARKATEAALAGFAQQLEARVAERTRDLRQHEAELTAILEYTNDAYICLDETGVITVWNRKAEDTFGWLRNEAIGQPMDLLLIPPHLRERHRQGLQRYLQTREARVLGSRIELPALCKDGRTIPVELHIHAIHLEHKTLFNAFLHEISERKEREVERELQALQDPLTTLLNRRALMEALPAMMLHAQAQNDSLALLFIDLDGFKRINDTLGHEAGDQLLIAIAQRLRDAVRNSDSVYRLAGDEFTIVLSHLKSLGHARLAAEKVLTAINRPVAIQDNVLTIQASIGVSMFDHRVSCTPAQLLKQADTAMYIAKRAGRNRVHAL